MSKGLYQPWAEMRRYHERLKRAAKYMAAECGRGGRGMLATPLGNFVADFNERGELTSAIEYVPTGGKPEGDKVDRLIYDDAIVPGGMANPYIEAAKAECEENRRQEIALARYLRADLLRLRLRLRSANKPHRFTCLSDLAEHYPPGTKIYDAALPFFVHHGGVVVVDTKTGRFADVEPGAIPLDRETALRTLNAALAPVAAEVYRPDYGYHWEAVHDDEAFDHEAFKREQHAEIARRTWEQEQRIIDAFLAGEIRVSRPAGYSIEGSLSPVGALRAELKEAGARMLKTCGTCKGTGGGAGGDGPICGTCRGSGSVAS